MDTPIALPVGNDGERITKALAIAFAYGEIDGAHHKMWVIDQMVRALTGCPVQKDGPTAVQGESAEYAAIMKTFNSAESGGVEWPQGIAP